MQVDPKYCSHSPLMLACELKPEPDVDTQGDIERVELLLKEGASAAFKNKVRIIICIEFCISLGLKFHSVKKFCS